MATRPIVATVASDDPQIAPMLQLLALAHYQARNYDEAVRHAQSAVRLNDSRAAAILAAGLARLGRFEDARSAYPLDVRERARAEAPRLVTYANPEDERHLRQGVRLAFLGGEGERAD